MRTICRQSQWSTSSTILVLHVQTISVESGGQAFTCLGSGQAGSTMSAKLHSEGW